MPRSGRHCSPGTRAAGVEEARTMRFNTLSLAFGERLSISVFSCLVASFMSSSGLKGSREAS